MTRTPDPATIPAPIPEQEGLVDPRPAFERVAGVFLAREADGGEHLDPGDVARELSVSRTYTEDLLRVLRAQRRREPQLSAVRMAVVRDRIQQAYLAREFRGQQQLDPAAVAREVGTTAAVARQWLRGLRTARDGDPYLGSLRAEPASHGQPTHEQLAALRAHFQDGGGHAAVGRPDAAEELAAALEARYWTREVRHGVPWTAAELARQVGVPRPHAADALRALRAGPATLRGRIEQLWWRQEVAHNRPLRPTQLARRLGSSPGYVRSVVWQLRLQHDATLPGSRLVAVRQYLTATPPEPVGSGEEDWRRQAACRDLDPDLFFPDVGQVPQATRAKEVCAGCQVRGPCLETALSGPLAGDDRHGIFAGTTARERQRLRGRPSAATPTRFFHDRALAEEALALANQVSIDRAARQLGVSKQALRRAFAEHGLPQPVEHRGGATPTRLYQDLEAATGAFKRAGEVGINQTRKELGVSDRALRNAWRHHGLGLPPRPERRTPPTPPLDQAFLALNPWLVMPPRLPADQQHARLRRAEELETLGVAAVTELTAESRWPRPAARVWAISRRAQRAERLAHQHATQPTSRGERAARLQADRASRPARRHADRRARTDRPSRADQRELPADRR